MLHRDRVRVRIVRYDRKGRPEGRVLDIIERRKASIIGRLLHENGMWLVAPEDRRYGQDILIPKNATAAATAGQVVAVELTEPPSMFSQPVGRVVEVLGEIDDPGMEIEIAVRKYEVPHRFSAESLAQAAALPDHVRAGRPAPSHRLDRRAAGHHRRRGCARLRRRGVLRADHARPRQERGRRLAAGGGDRRRQPLREARRADRRRRLRTRDLGVLSAPRDPDAAGEALQRPVFAEPRAGSPGDGLRHGGRRRRRDHRLPVLPGGDLLAGALHLHRGGGDPRQHARPRGAAAQRAGAAPDPSARGLPRAAQAPRHARRGGFRDHRNADRRRRERPHRAHRAAQAQRGAPPDRRGDAGGQRVCGRVHRRPRAPGAVPRARRADHRKAHHAAELPEGDGPGRVAVGRPDARRVAGDRAGHARAARRGADPRDAAALDAAGALHGRQQRPLRPRVRGLHALHEPDPPLSRPAGASGHQGAAQRQALPPGHRCAGRRAQARPSGNAQAHGLRAGPGAMERRGRALQQPTSGAPTKPRATSRRG